MTREEYADLMSGNVRKDFARTPVLKTKDSTPTRQVTGTSYKAQGAEGVKPPSLEELGSAVGTIWVDPVPDVGTPVQASRTYLKMVRDDASVRVSMRAGKAPVLGAEWFMEPYSDNPVDLAVNEFVEFNLFNGMTIPWIKVVEQILQMYEAGKTVFEPVWELREWAPRKSNAGANRRQYTMLRKLAYRPPTTIGKVNYDDNGGPVSIDHTAISADGRSKQVTLPIEKIVVFTFDQQGGGLEGMPILRSAYKHWWYKNRFYNIDAIQKERHSIGIPDIEVQPGASPRDIELAHEMGQNLKTNEKSYIVRPPTIKVGFAQVHGSLVNVLESAEHHDNMIMKNIMVQFLNLGTNVSSSGGGRATGATSMDMFLKAMRHIAQTVCDVINMYLIPNLVAYNFQVDTFPRLSVRGVGEVKDMQMWSAAMRNLCDADLISIDEETEQWVRAQIDMPRFVGDWVPITERPTTIQEQGKPEDFDAAGNPIPPTDTPVEQNGKGNGKVLKGNIGKSPSSGAV